MRVALLLLAVVGVGGLSCSPRAASPATVVPFTLHRTDPDSCLWRLRISQDVPSVILCACPGQATQIGVIQWEQAGRRWYVNTSPDSLGHEALFQDQYRLEGYRPPKRKLRGPGQPQLQDMPDQYRVQITLVSDTFFRQPVVREYISVEASDGYQHGGGVTNSEGQLLLGLRALEREHGAKIIDSQRVVFRFAGGSMQARINGRDTTIAMDSIVHYKPVYADPRSIRRIPERLVLEKPPFVVPLDTTFPAWRVQIVRNSRMRWLHIPPPAILAPERDGTWTLVIGRDRRTRRTLAGWRLVP